MLRLLVAYLGVAVACVLSIAAPAQNPASTQSSIQAPARDTSAQPNQPTPTARIAGTVVAADTGRPVKRARVLAQAAELPGGRATQTDDHGAFEIADLPAGRYTITVSKNGFIALSYGQRRPLQAGTPLELGEAQQLKGVDFRLPRGGAIAGRIVDEDGEPVPGAAVRVMRYQYLQGERRLVQAGIGQTDDKGQYRVWGLQPGEYYVTATARTFGGPGGPFGGGFAGRFGGPGGAAGPAFFGGRGGEDPQDSMAYAPTFYPGVASVNEAPPLTLGVSQELLDVSFALQLVRTARVSGKVTTADGTAATSGTVTLSAEGMAAPGGRGPIGMSYASRIQWDGSFTISNVPPGRYVLRARAGGDQPQYAQQPLSVSSGDVAGLIVGVSPGGTISGTVSFPTIDSSPPGDMAQIRITAPPADQGQFASGTGRVDKDGRFVFEGIPSGLRFIRVNGAPRGWMLKSVLIGGREVIDTPIEVRPGETIRNITLVFTDQQSQISGVVTTDRGTRVTAYTVLAFTTDQSLWRPQSRQIMTARPDQNGKYQIRGLPPGEYFVALVDPAEPGEWFEPSFLDAHRPGAVRVSLGDGDAKVQDLKVRN